MIKNWLISTLVMSFQKLLQNLLCFLGRQRFPIESVIHSVLEGSEQVAEQLPKVHVIRNLFELQLATVFEVLCKLDREALYIT
jgi:hypothetical protein